MNLVIFIIGIFVGGLLFWLYTKPKKPSGSFVIDFSDPMKDVCTLEMDEDLNDIYTKKCIMLKVRVVEDDSQN